MTPSRAAAPSHGGFINAAGLLASVAIAVSLASALALLAERSWLLELLAHFRLQYLAVQLPLLALLVWRRLWSLAALCAPFIFVNAAALAPYWPHAAAAIEPGPSIKLLSVNLYARNHDYPRLVELVRREDPDVMVLLEIDAGWAHALEALAAEYPQRLVAAREDFFGIAVLSRLPLIQPHVADLRGSPTIDARVALADGRDFRIIGVHLRPPTSAAHAAERNAQLADLRAMLAGYAQPLIVTGDFNVTPYSPLLADWLEQTGLEDVRLGRGFRATWPTYFPILGVPIDHCLISEHFAVGEHYQGPAFGSDHYPVLTRLFLRAG